MRGGPANGCREWVAGAEKKFGPLISAGFNEVDLFLPLYFLVEIDRPPIYNVFR
jgi:hypothetical protein